jgi:hypothetical protein
MKRIIYAVLLLSSSLTMAQTEPSKLASGNTAAKDSTPPDPDWKLSAITSILANQANFTNWQAGGVNSMSYSAYLDLSADYSKDKWSWDNDIKLGFGQQFQEETDWRKTDDILHYITKAGYALDSSKNGGQLAQLVSELNLRKVLNTRMTLLFPKRLLGWRQDM